MGKFFVLYEHATGYALFKVKQFEEIGMFLPNLEASVTDICRFRSLVKLVGFSRFTSSVTALENIRAISEGILTEQLQMFLSNTTITKKHKAKLGVSDSKLSAAITEVLNISCTHIGVVPEIIRGIRTHFVRLVHEAYSSMSDKVAGIAQLGLGHAYSRARIKLNVNRVDNMIIQSIGLLDQLEKDVNLFYMRIREWYSFHYPELVQLVPDIVRYARLVNIIQDKKTLNEKRLAELEKVGVDSDTAKTILDTARSSMGMDISAVDMLNIVLFANRVVSLAEYRNNLAKYLHTKMKAVAPNLACLVGDLVGARLISRAGSLTNLAKMPSSTVQVLGAEKALFRALKTRSATPKYGLLYNASYIGRAGQHKGRISRYLAAKCSIAARIDCFADHVDTPDGSVVSNVYGKKLREQIESRLKFYETGDIPQKNLDAMLEAKQEVQRLQQEINYSGKKQIKLNNKRKNEKDITDEPQIIDADLFTAPTKPKKKKKTNSVAL